MKPLKSLLLAALFGAMALPAMAQGRKSLVINEVMVVNDSSIVDEYGHRTAWVEILNPTQGPVDISSIYLTDDLSQPTKYVVPKGDVRTHIDKGQTALFHADGRPNHGTFHMSFTLVPGQDNVIAIYDADGINLIDSVTVPASLAANTSYARVSPYDSKWQQRDDSSKGMAITPGGSNTIKEQNSKIETFKEMDENGIAMTIMAMCIVFSALLILCLCFMLIKKIAEKKEKPEPEPVPMDLPGPSAEETAQGEVAAAIAMALHQHLAKPNGILTIVHNPATGWTSKSQLMRHLPQK